MNWIPDDYGNPNTGDAPGSTTRHNGAAPVAGDDAGTLRPDGDGPPPPIRPASGRSGRLPDLSPVALAAGLVGLLAGPALIGDTTARYVILAADLVALAFGALGVWVSLKRIARLDYAVAAILMGGVSLFLWISYVTDPPQGGT